MALNSEEFGGPSGATLAAGRRGYPSVSGGDSTETLAGGRETGMELIFTVRSAGANERPVCWLGMRTANAQSSMDKKIPFRKKDLRRDRAGWLLPSMKRFSS